MSLDEDTNDEFRHRYSDSRVFKYVVDTAANMSYSTVVMSALEYFALDMEPEQVLKSRLSASVLNLATGRPYGIYRDFVFRKLSITESSSGKSKYLADLVALNSFHLPTYAGLLAIVGADAHQVLGGVAVVAGLSLFMGRTMGWWMDRVRRWCGVRTAYENTMKT